MISKKLCGKTSHSWGDWKYIDEENCTQIRVCSRCGNKEERVQHLWNYTESPGGPYPAQYCERCGAWDSYLGPPAEE